MTRPQSLFSRCAAVAATAALLALPVQASAQASCSTEPLALQVLGSGGPPAGDTRASTGYLIWRDGRAVVMIDAGGGTYLRFGEAGAKLEDLSVLAISHLHPDHVSDLPALLWLSEVARKRPLKIAGPSGAGPYPAFDLFLERLFAADAGAFPVLGGMLGQPGRGVRLDVTVVDASADTAQRVTSDSGIEVRAIGVPHGETPSIAYRVDLDGHSIVFGSDQTGADPTFATFATGADLLVMHFGLSEQAGAPVANLHAKPTAVGQVAQAAKARQLVLSHLMKAPPAVPMVAWFSLFDLDQTVAEVGKHYSGPIMAATDLQCIPVR